MPDIAGSEEQIIYALLEGLGLELDKLECDRATSYFFDDILPSDSEGRQVSLFGMLLGGRLGFGFTNSLQKLLGKTDGNCVKKGLIDDKQSYPTCQDFFL